MAQYMLLVYQEEVDESEQAERERHMPLFVELHRSLAGSSRERHRKRPETMRLDADMLTGGHRLQRDG